MTEKEYKATEKKFSVLFDQLYDRGLSADEQKEYNRLRDILVNYDNQRIFCGLLRSGDYRTN